VQVILAEAYGLCFGVRDALALAAATPLPADVTIRGELVHNERVLHQLEVRGFRQVGESRTDAIPETPFVMITAHGISDAHRQRLNEAGKQLIDTTCPLVRRVHRAARSLAAEGRHVIVIGRPGHVEVRGIVEDLPSHVVVDAPESVAAYHQPCLGVVCQSTTSPRLAASVLAAIRVQNPRADIAFIDTICQPTRDRQEALRRLAEQVDAVVVVGGKNSNNTRELAAVCEAAGRRTLHVQSAFDLDAAWFDGCQVVGLTAGTSTLDETVEEVRQALVGMS